MDQSHSHTSNGVNGARHEQASRNPGNELDGARVQQAHSYTSNGVDEKVTRNPSNVLDGTRVFKQPDKQWCGWCKKRNKRVESEKSTSMVLEMSNEQEIQAVDLQMIDSSWEYSCSPSLSTMMLVWQRNHRWRRLGCEPMHRANGVSDNRAIFRQQGALSDSDQGARVTKGTSHIDPACQDVTDVSRQHAARLSSDLIWFVILLTHLSHNWLVRRRGPQVLQ